MVGYHQQQIILKRVRFAVANRWERNGEFIEINKEKDHFKEFQIPIKNSQCYTDGQKMK
jgi:hypothetical protein